MLMAADARFRRDEAGEVLQLSPAVIDALVSSGALRVETIDGRDTIAAAELERLFRDSLMRLWHGQATRAAAVSPGIPADAGAVAEEVEIEIEAKPDADSEEPAIVGVYDELGTGARPDLRAGVRYVPRRQIGGTFRDVRFVMLQLSSSGLRIRHDDALRPGDEARLSFAILSPPKSFVMRARVIWTSIGQRGDQRSYYVSGLRVIENVDRLVNAAYLLRTARELHIDETDTARRPGGVKNVPRQVSGVADEDVVAIIQAVRKLAGDPEEAARWYARARFAIADEEVRKAAPRGAREREEVVGVWESLQRRIDLRTVAGVMQWIRSSQVAAV
jgi:hypothetical protein